MSAARLSIDEATIGHTPLISLDIPGITNDDTGPRVYGKVEWFNLYETPYGGGSIKSRIAKSMLDAGERDGLLPGRTIIEPTSGNTGSEIAKLGTARGYEVEIVMPDNASGGKINAIRDAGARIHFVNADEGYDAVLRRCEEIIQDSPGKYYRPNQYTNPENPGAHEATTGPEIWDQTGGAVTHFVAGVGTGGTVTGTGRALHARGDVTVVGFEPANPLHAIDGLKYLRTGDHYHPETYEESVLDDKRYVDTGDAYDQARQLKATYDTQEIRITHPGQYDENTVREHLRVNDAFLVGTSSGAAVQVVRDLVEDGDVTADDHVVVILADRGDKYADIPLWESFFSND